MPSSDVVIVGRHCSDGHLGEPQPPPWSTILPIFLSCISEKGSRKWFRSHCHLHCCQCLRSEVHSNEPRSLLGFSHCQFPLPRLGFNLRNLECPNRDYTHVALEGQHIVILDQHRLGTHSGELK
ncbi:hypothetical protein V6N12_070396 [Hibiscus sabdariffa]|uniref:Uncharacterized protein n=1 Tax=Hibiscus sabdariffa TaxID=183260 RepID=A0ABR2FGN7_9ROSI